MNYYEILGLSRHASEGEVKKAYKRLALKWHPDKNPNDSERARDIFQKISEAYEVLSDPVKRRNFDHHGSAFEHFNDGRHHRRSFAFRDPTTVFDEFFGPFSWSEMFKNPRFERESEASNFDDFFHSNFFSGFEHPSAHDNRHVHFVRNIEIIWSAHQSL